MSLKVVKDELIKTLDAATSGFAGNYKIGLFKNNFTPGNTSVIGDVTPADFSGYSTVGLHTFSSWASATWNSPRAEATHADVTWTHNGGGTSNDIYGYYVVDGSGNLAWAERYASAPVTLSGSGQSFTVSPKYTRRSEF